MEHDRFEVFGDNAFPQHPTPPVSAPALSPVPFGAFRRISSSPSQPLPHSSSPLPSSSFSSPLPTPRKRKSDGFIIKVSLANMIGKKVGESSRMQYFSLSPTNANVPAIISLAEEGFGVQPLILVHANGLQMEDTAATRDNTFWRCSARKIFAVKREEFVGTFDRFTDGDNHVRESIDEIKTMLQENILLPRDVGALLKSTLLIEPLKETFKCVVCQDISASPIAISMCCKQVLGCSTCVDQWTELRCPHCRNEFYETVTVNVFENILAILNNL
ncbi:uncharacterized protein LOC130635599 [Hydractinia symbiolongicarpus]|uniref:uncharacterized protein LOC130635599 n=1 Tax=Hydractinia symbiolongicarpus TaxID=13093 RepID=UPI00254AE1EE|nr:uncharacterized protein LOC130635599 [Hydractinia symbiolongicarpus]